MKQYLIFILGFLITLQVIGQDFITISGKVIDSEIKEPLPFATISIQNTTKGVVANEEGEFDLIASQEDSIMISTLGYDPFFASINDILSSKQTIFKLNSRPVLLDEVIVSERNKQLNPSKVWSNFYLQLSNAFISPTWSRSRKSKKLLSNQVVNTSQS